MENTENSLDKDRQERQGWLFVLMDEKDSNFVDIGFTCGNCGNYHSIYIPCPKP